MEQRTLLALVLSVAVIVLYQHFVIGTSGRKLEKDIHGQKAIPVQPVEKMKERETQDPLGDDSFMDPWNSKGLAALDTPISPGMETLPGKREERKVETAYAQIVLDNLGGQVKAIYLKKYMDKKGKPVNLIGPRQGGSFPFLMRSMDPELDRIINRSLYETSSYDLELSPQKLQGLVEFIYRTPSGLVIRKSYTFHYQSYSFSVMISLEGLPSEKPLGVYRLLLESVLEGSDADGARPHYEGPLVLWDKKIVKEVKEYGGNVSWAALNSKYFLLAFLPQHTFSPQHPFSIVVEEKVNDRIAIGMEFSDNYPSLSQELVFYAGPKEVEALRQADPSLEKAIDYDYGRLSFLTKPLLWSLHVLYRFTGNYGVAIILMTILIKILFFPLSYKSFKSMQAMKEIQPKMKDLQDKFKGDKQKLNQEMFSLYRKEKVNPFGGCMPMLLQMPVFIALYWGLMNAIELWNAPFWGWIVDLSSKDPYYIYPILMGASMVVQQKMTPAMGGDPMQQKMMMFMPLVFTIMFLNFPVGLVIYWLVSNILTIIQQYFTMNLVATTPPGATSKKWIKFWF